MTMKIARSMLETHLELPAGTLKTVKDTVAQVIDEVRDGCRLSDELPTCRRNDSVVAA